MGDEGKVRPLLRAIVSLMVEKIVQKKRLGQVLHILKLKKRRILSKSRDLAEKVRIEGDCG